MDEDYEQVLLVKPDIYIYKIPARVSNRSHRASDWKLEEPDWNGRLRLILKANKCYLKIEDSQTGKLYAQCYIDKYPGTAIESVSDSSRYFVLKIRNDVDGRTAFIGLGFADRCDSFDLNVALQDHFKRLEKEEKMIKNEKLNDNQNQPKLDLSLKDGQTIKVNLNIGKKNSGVRARPKSSSVSSIGILPPPPCGVKPVNARCNLSPSINQNSNDKKEELKINNAAFDNLLSSNYSPGKPLSNESEFKTSTSSNVDLLLDFGDLNINNNSKNNTTEPDWSNFESYPVNTNQKVSNWTDF